MMRKVVTNRNIREKVYEIVHEYVISSAVPPGAKIDEEQLASKLGVSKTPVREALSKLAIDGIVRIKPHRGAYKVQLSKEDIAEIMLIRETLEGLCARLAAKNVDARAIKRLEGVLDTFEEKDLAENISSYPEVYETFHRLVYDLTKSPRLTRIVQSVRDLSHMLRVQYFRTPERVARSLATHRRLLEALKKGDAELAETTCKRMTRSGFETLLKEFHETEVPVEIVPKRRRGRT